MTGQTVAHYRILEKLGEGGMGVVYRAEDTRLGRTVALKFLATHLLESEEHKQRFLREAKAAASLDHPNICTVHEVGEAGGQVFLAMGFIDGREVRAKIRERPLKLDEALDIALQAAEGLRAAHQRGIVHRDIKSSNLMLTPTGQVKLMDFGLAQFTEGTRLTRADTVVGTPGYMSPEQAQRGATDRRSDIWSLGVVLYEMVTGRLPFEGDQIAAVIHAIIREPHEPVTALRAGLSVELDRIIGKCLAKSPVERYQHLDDLLVDLRALRRGLTGDHMASRRRWLWPTATASIALAAGTWLGLSRWKPWITASSTGPRLSDGSRPSTNSEANTYYERGLLFAGSGPRANLAQWRRMLERALALDPRFAAARGQYAFTSMLAAYFGISSEASLLYKAEEEARQALLDDPDCAVAHSALAGIYFCIGRKELGLVEADKALHSNPHDPAIHLWFPLYHQANGDYQQATQLTRKILTRWPLFTPARAYLAQVLREQGDAPGAFREWEQILEQDAQNPYARWGMARAYMDLGDLPRARKAMERVDSRHRANYQGRLNWALLLALENRKLDAFRELDEQTRNYAGISYLGALQPAEVYAVGGDADKALEWLDRAVRSGDERENWLRRDPHLATIRCHPRFRQVLDSVAYRRRQRSDDRNR